MSRKKTRRTKTKVALEWQEEKYVPAVHMRPTPHTGHTKVLYANPGKPTAEEQRRTA